MFRSNARNGEPILDQVDVLSRTIIQGHKGIQYITLLGLLHTALKPQTYLEIGARSGNSLALASCRSVAIDPFFKLEASFLNKKEMCCLYQMTSDLFFERYNPQHVLGGKIDFAFLDGMHLAEFLLRDFFNTEPHCNRNSIIALHDCIPLDAAMARRRESGPDVVRSPHNPDWWTGDVWKVVAILKKYRPELRIYPVDAQPTGLILITNLGPTSALLKDRYFDILDEFNSMDYSDLEKFLTTLDVKPTSDFASAERIARYLYL